MVLTKEDIKRIILACRIAGEYGLSNGCKACIKSLEVDFVSQDRFLGAKENPAIFVNSNTYRLLGRYHQSWKVNETIVVKESILKESPMKIIGILVHETGHAFNVAAGITNSEANAYIFEIEVITRWFKNGHSLLFNCSKLDIQSYFESRLPYYRSEMIKNDYLTQLITLIEQRSILNDDVYLYKLFVKKSVGFTLFVEPQSLKLDPVKSERRVSECIQILAL